MTNTLNIIRTRYYFNDREEGFIRYMQNKTCQGKLILTEQESIRAFRIMWWEMARTACDKTEVKTVDSSLWVNRCSLCQYVRYSFLVTVTGYLNCRKCPIDWPGGECDMIGGLYHKWKTAKGFYVDGIDRLHQKRRMKALALEICNLPLKAKH